MLFSNPEVADLMNDRFVCAWESVRSVPTVEIDFGNGHHMKRTLNGNVITFLCTPEGKVFDALPGLYSAEGYSAALRRALDLYVSMARREMDPSRPCLCSPHWIFKLDEQRVAAYHALAAQGVERIAVMRDGRVTADNPMRYASKAAVEEPIKVLLANGLDTPEARFATAQNVAQDSDPALTTVVSKTKVEEPVKVAMVAANYAPTLLSMDTQINERLRKEQIHAMLAMAPLPTPSDLRGRIYKEVLHVDIDDPYLGLGHILFNGAEGETK